MARQNQLILICKVAIQARRCLMVRENRRLGLFSLNIEHSYLMISAPSYQHWLRGPWHWLDSIRTSQCCHRLNLRCWGSRSLHWCSLSRVCIGLLGPGRWIDFPETNASVCIFDDLGAWGELFEGDWVLGETCIATVDLFTHVFFSTCHDLNWFFVDAKLRYD